MNTDKQAVEEMTRDICSLAIPCEECAMYAEKAKLSKERYCKAKLYAKRAYNKGYRKQSVGEWIEIDDGVLIGDGKHLECSECGVWKKNKQRSNFCPNCGAKMKGGE